MAGGCDRAPESAKSRRWARVCHPYSIHGRRRHKPKVNKCEATPVAGPLHAGGGKDTPTTGNKAALFTKNSFSPLFPSRDIPEMVKHCPAQSKSPASDLLCWVTQKRNGEEVAGGCGGGDRAGDYVEQRGCQAKYSIQEVPSLTKMRCAVSVGPFGQVKGGEQGLAGTGMDRS